MEDVESPNDPIGGQPGYDSDLEEMKVRPIFGSMESVDFETPDKPRKLKIGTSLYSDERDRLIDVLSSY